jgi:hypothetical protein
VRGLNVKSSQQNGTGAYQVFFKSNVAQCAPVVSIGSADGNFQIGAGEASTVQGTGVSKNSVVVIVNDTQGNDADKPFLLIVQC